MTVSTSAIENALLLLRGVAQELERETRPARRAHLAQVLQDGAADVARMAALQARVLDTTTGYLGQDGDFACYAT